MSSSSTRILKPLYLMIVLVVPVVFQTSAFAQTVLIRVDGDNGSPTPPGQGDAWGAGAFQFLQDAMTLARANATPATPYEIWVAATIQSNPYVPDRDAANPDGTGDRDSTFLLDFENVILLGGFLGNETDPDDRDPDENVTVLGGILGGRVAIPLPATASRTPARRGATICATASHVPAAAGPSARWTLSAAPT